MSVSSISVSTIVIAVAAAVFAAAVIMFLLRGALVKGLAGQLASGSGVNDADARAEAMRLNGQVATLTERAERLEAAAAEIRGRAEALQAELRAEQERRSQAEKLVESLRVSLEEERKGAQDKLKTLMEAREELTNQFKALGAEILQSQGEQLKTANKEQMEHILKPLNDRLGEFGKAVTEAREQSVADRAAVTQQIEALTRTSARMTSETVNLTRALKGASKAQGMWGEMVLSTLLEQSGLRAGHEYETQQSHTTDDGKRVITDVLVSLPGGQKVIIDSKVSLTAFEEAVNAETDEERIAAGDRHLASMRAHIRGLSGKSYQASAGGDLDYVIMFVPIEGALALALERDPRLTTLAVELNVAIATPTTLMIALRTIHNVWTVERRNQNAAAIAERAGFLYDKFVGFLSELKSVGTAIGRAQSSYDEAVKKLGTGRGNLVSQAEKLKRLGAKTTGAIPTEFAIDEDADELEAAPTPGLIAGSLEREEVA